MSIDRGMDKGDVAHTYSGILLSHKKNETMPFAANWVDLEFIILCEISERQQTSSDITHMWNLKNKGYK